MTITPWNVDCIDDFYDGEDVDDEDEGWGSQDDEEGEAEAWEAFDDLDEIAP